MFFLYESEGERILKEKQRPSSVMTGTNNSVQFWAFPNFQRQRNSTLSMLGAT